MCCEPEVGVEDGDEHLHGVAIKGEVVGDDEGDEADGAGDDGADAVFVNALKEDAEEDGAPADKDGGGVEVGDGWAAFEDHAEDEAGGVD